MKLINVEYALRQLEIGEFEHRGVFETDSSHIKDFLNALPSVDAVEVVHGKWLYDSGSGKYFCSACDENALSFRMDTFGFGEVREVCLSDYCPNCGAKMDGGN